MYVRVSVRVHRVTISKRVGYVYVYEVMVVCVRVYRPNCVLVCVCACASMCVCVCVCVCIRAHAHVWLNVFDMSMARFNLHDAEFWLWKIGCI